MSSKGIITENLTLIDEEVNNKEDAIYKMVDLCYANNLISDKTEFYNKVLQRENEMSTAIGYQIAMPHGKSDDVTEPFVAFLRSSDNFKWNVGDQYSVKLVFLIGVNSENSGIHLKFISSLSKKLLDEKFRSSLINAQNIDGILNIIKKIEI